MSTLQLTSGIQWVGVLDRELRVFDVIMKADHGTTYNSYLIMGENGCALIDTSKAKFKDQYLENVSSLVDLSQINYIIMNHTEPDHSGSLDALLSEASSATVVSSRNAVPFIRGILNRDIEIKTAGDGDIIDLGGLTLEFIVAPFLHWPDTMFTFVRKHGVLFPCDFFGSHFADRRMFDDQVDDFTHSRRYYFNHIFRPFKEFVTKALDRIEGLPIQMIAPSHGPVLRRDLHKYIEEYRVWSTTPEKKKKPYVLVFYCTSYGNTGRMAENAAQGARDAGAEVALFDLQATDISSVLDDVEIADAIIVGSLTINGDAVKVVWDFLSSLATLKLRGKSAAAFGSYGWSGEAVKFIEDRLKSIKFKIPVEGVRAQLIPTDENLAECRALGNKLVQSISS